MGFVYYLINVYTLVWNILGDFHFQWSKYNFLSGLSDKMVSSLIILYSCCFSIAMTEIICSSTQRSSKVIFIRHGITEMNEYLSSRSWGSRGFKAVGFGTPDCPTLGYENVQFLI